jgi:rhomboid family GlyGly-CTERM serine protease
MNSRQTELALFALVLAAANAPLLFGRICTALIFVPAQVAGGEWWRVLTGPFVHVSAYHLLLDAGAFLMLYRGLRADSAARRLLTAAVCAAGSLAFALPSLESAGSLCGLSGVAHGLLAVTALEMTAEADRATARLGWAALLLVAGKSALEALSGHVLFESLHLGDVATPVAVCHLGGVMGGVLAHAAFSLLERNCAKVNL